MLGNLSALNQLHQLSVQEPFLDVLRDYGVEGVPHFMGHTGVNQPQELVLCFRLVVKD